MTRFRVQIINWLESKPVTLNVIGLQQGFFGFASEQL